MGSPLAQHPDVQEIIRRIGDRDTDWLETVRNKRVPSPTHLMYACSAVLGDGGQEHIADMMKKVPGKQRRGKFIDLAIQLAQAEDSVDTPQEEVVEQVVEQPNEVSEHIVEEVEEIPQPKPKRKRRTKAEMEAARAPSITPEQVETLIESQLKLSELVRELSKAVYALDEKLERANLVLTSKVDNVQAETRDATLMLNAIKEGLLAAELELVMSGKLGVAAIGDCIEEHWPNQE